MEFQTAFASSGPYTQQTSHPFTQLTKITEEETRPQILSYGNIQQTTFYNTLPPFKSKTNHQFTSNNETTNTTFNFPFKHMNSELRQTKRTYLYPIPENADAKERNRIAAQQWRKRENNRLINLEEINDSLRITSLKLQYQIYTLKAENKILEEELQYFQRFMTKLVTQK